MSRFFTVRRKRKLRFAICRRTLAHPPKRFSDKFVRKFTKFLRLITPPSHIFPKRRAVEYIAEKTKSHQPRTIRVPLNDKAKAILAKYADLETRLLPKINRNICNYQIKKFPELLGINRMVTIIDNKTREPIQKPICDIAMSHTARKTFIGNLYKKVKGPNLVASLSGHTDGSQAFARYREIDNDMKRELVALID